VKLEIAVNDEFVQPAVDAIMGGARTGQIGDGKIFVLEPAAGHPHPHRRGGPPGIG